MQASTVSCCSRAEHFRPAQKQSTDSAAYQGGQYGEVFHAHTQSKCLSNILQGLFHTHCPLPPTGLHQPAPLLIQCAYLKPADDIQRKLPPFQSASASTSSRPHFGMPWSSSDAFGCLLTSQLRPYWAHAVKQSAPGGPTTNPSGDGTHSRPVKAPSHPPPSPQYTLCTPASGVIPFTLII